MPSHINKGVEDAYSRGSSQQKEPNIFFEDSALGNKIFPSKRENDDGSSEPAIKPKCDWLNFFDNASCNNKITRPY